MLAAASYAQDDDGDTKCGALTYKMHTKKRFKYIYCFIV